MLRTLFAGLILCLCGTAGAFAQSGQSPELQQTTSTTNTRRANPPKPVVKKTSLRQRMKMEQKLDSALPKDRPKQPLRPDSLRRGGATRVDSVRR